MPALSVILPVFNAAAFLKEAIESVLAQTYSDFELIIINDGSEDDPEAIILLFKDPRIVYIKHTINLGLIASLNEAIGVAKGQWIARMDADDVCFPQRFEKQLKHLQSSNAAIHATRVKLINEEGLLIADWKADRDYVSADSIRYYLPINNCIAHPSVMGKAEVFKKYKYQLNQKYSEDYDLWLRLLAEGHIITKDEEPLLYYRVLPTSATRAKKVNVFYRLAKVKARFVQHQLLAGNINLFVMKVLIFAGVDCVKATGKEAKKLLQ